MNKSLEKICTTCGRRITWRKKWERNWDAISHCSDSCRKHRVRPGSLDLRFEEGILELLRERREASRRGWGGKELVTCEEVEGIVLGGEGLFIKSGLRWKTELGGEERDDDLGEKVLGTEKEGDLRGQEKRDKNLRVRERCRQAARRLAARGEIVIRQDGKVTDPSFTKGVMELKLSKA